MKKKIYLLIALFILTSTIISLILYSNYRFIHEIGFVEQATWNTINGDFYQAISNGGNHFARHNSPILFIFLPIYYLFSNIIIITITNNIFIALGAIPIFLFAKKTLKNDFAAIIFSTSYLLFPAFFYSNLRSFHPIMLSVSLIGFALYFLSEKKWAWFYSFIFLAMLTNETISLLAIMIGIYIFISKNKKKGLILILIGIVWFHFSTNIVMPHFGLGESYPYFAELYGHLGNNMGEVIVSVIKDPIGAFAYGNIPAKINYLKILLQHNLFLSILSPLMLLTTIPVILQNILSASGYKYDITAHYIYPIISIVFFASILGLKKIFGFLKKNNININIILIIVLVLSLFNAFNYGLKPLIKDNCETFHILNCKPTSDIIGNAPKENNVIIKNIINMIPKNASVMTQNHLYSYFSNRKETYLFSLFLFNPDSEYILIDTLGFNIPHENISLFIEEELPALGYKIISQNKSVYLLTQS